ncbi:hypothetical protein [Actinoplanes couchii]|uniref:Uncharacterized protein n=1 Tax=Actinoplanes couchii TaxID=403638 RepID=A0ABQ3X823_9ACTN|nr:hypothetical protein [Actinoplanes couchii]MDR6320334.1 hypothetical protein [Actinoplanes couchii]GID54652.1 hypothetical protein Aco03nite_030560 [Actinoplanes couchii]
MTHQVHLEYAEADEPAGTVVGAVEILDADLCTWTGAPVLAGRSSPAEVPRPGRYVAQGRLAGGAWIGASFQVPDRIGTPVRVQLEQAAPGPDRQAVPDDGRTCWAAGFTRQLSRWSRVPLNRRAERPTSLELFPTSGSRPENTAVLVGGDGMPARFVITPVDAGLQLARSGSSIRAQLAPGPEHTLLSFLSDGDLVCARIVADHLLAEPRRARRRPLTLLAVGYHLTMTGDDRAQDWADEDLRWLSTSPDALVITAWSRADDAGAFRRLLVEAATLGPPAVGIGLGLLRDGLYLLDDTDPAVARAIRAVRRYQTARLPGILTSYHGDSPESPAARVPPIGIPDGLPVETFRLGGEPQPRPVEPFLARLRSMSENFLTAQLTAVTYFDTGQRSPGPVAATLELTEAARGLLGDDITGSVSLRRGTLRVTLARIADEAAGTTVYLTIDGAEPAEIMMTRRGGSFTAELPWPGDMPQQLGFRVETGDDRL